MFKKSPNVDDTSSVDTEPEWTEWIGLTANSFDHLSGEMLEITKKSVPQP